MTRMERFLKFISIALGLTSAAFFIFDYLLFSQLRPRMVRFDAISPAEEGLLNWVGVGLLIFLVFCLLSLLRIVNYLKNANTIPMIYVFLIVGGVISIVLVFSDVALLGDIGKQYKHGFAQPEWYLVYPIMTFQFLTAISLTCLHLFGFKREKQVEQVVRDSNIFLIVHYVGIICSLMGLALASLGFFFPRVWSLDIHTTLTSIILLFPYGLIVAYWFYVKFREKNRQWYDEKQILDIGKSAFATLVISVVVMSGLFISNYRHLDGVISILWLPLYLFSTLFLFSACNLFFSRRG